MTHRVLLLTALALCHGFNLDTQNAVIFQENARGFGQSVVQFEGSRVVVGAPQEIKAANQTGGLYQCDYSTGTCEPIPLQVPPEALNMSLGLSLAFATNPSQLLACGPTVHQVCKENIYVNGLCFLFGRNLLQQPQKFPKALRECPQQDSDIAILIDGSGSINSYDFQKMKEFVSTVMNQFKSKTLFSLMQFSDDFQTHFTFKEFKDNPNPDLLVRPIKQLRGWTYTATAIRKVVRELFQRRNGARENSLKILVVITDGEKSRDPLEYEDVIPEADREGIIRYVIGVGSAFNSERSRQELNTIASKPALDHVFRVNNFEALKTIQNQLQEKIFAIEGTQTGSTSSFEYEMSQEGFSASITSNGPLLGAVGSFDWAGGAFLHMPRDKVTFINTTRVDSDMNDAYLGYAADVISRSRVQMIVLGAPRYQHTGMVVLFRQNAGTWETNTVIKGSQIGSYFGASLCSVDVDRDGSSDLVLIGAPHYYDSTRGGQVSVCPLPRGRIAGSQISPRLQYFGQSLSGGQDLTMDGLVDLVIGAQGHALLLRSQPVLTVDVTMEFTPRELAREVFECHEHVVKGQPAGEARVCLRVHKTTRDRLQEGEIQSIVTYDLALDPSRSHPRAIFEETKNRTCRRTQMLRLKQECETLKLQLPECVEDSVTPIILRLNFSLEGQPSTSFGGLRPVLAVDAQRLFTASFPFEKNCGNDSICQDDLSVTFSFMSLNTLVVGGPRDFNVTLTVRNQGEDSYSTHLTFFYPPGLSYRTVSGVQNQPSWRSWHVTCVSDTSTKGPRTSQSSSCNINHPIFPGNSEVTFNVTLDVESNAFFGNRALFKANMTSENNVPRTNRMEFQLELPVKYAVYVVVTSQDISTKYLNFTASEKTRHIIKHQYQFKNLGQRSLPVSVVFWVPVQLNQVAVWDAPQVTFSQNLSSMCHTEKRVPPHSDFLAEIKKVPVLNCSIAVCHRIQCDLLSFDSQEEFNVTLTGNLSFDWYIKSPHSYLQVVSTAEILFDEVAFTLLPGQGAFVRAQTETKVEPHEVHNPIPLIVGSSVGGLVLLALITAGLYKLGFFKRQYKDMMGEAGPEAAPPQ
ncbi:PREDICTED: integrin alpha-M-like isoform X2 [Hipposideros armiger]|uniref:Integrin alpha-M-like isoform X2 n=1 Tax=Hipposideros armiger TaxID=186990 RepID=A0A8B7Q7W3_HIPAR|nr:PREDICTED: integrin alpha-M-like isoform X2 [Hipposideros armiger]